MTKSKKIASYFMRITELRDKLKSSGDNLEEKDLIMTTLNGLPPSWESFIQTISGWIKLPKFGKLWAECTQEEQESQHAKDFMALNLRKIKRSYLMPRKAREGEGSRTFTSIKIRDQVLPQIKKNIRRIYLKPNAIDARNTAIMPITVKVQSKGSMKLQLLM